MQIQGKVAVVTGGGSGLGKATCYHLSALGAKLAIFDLNSSGLSSDSNILSYAIDITDEQPVAMAIEEVMNLFGAIHICVNCAGIAPAEKILSSHGPLPLAHFHEVINTNLIGSFNVMSKCAEQMAHNAPEHDERGVIINTASIAAYEGQKGQAAYSASKAGIVGITLPAARELSEYGIRVNAIAPGVFDTEMMQHMPDKVRHTLQQQIEHPKRFGEPLEFAQLVEHLIQNPYLNGEVIRLDGGLRMS
ncbi:SDR family NAD(P)-dependent oxidoreductase [Neptuniibacter sp.]|uniref:SDR family NAD(P)-dependent oxidoreductase n=1 Tax=Neptuniibacter sp. TaxID=1962643 RepID=UPI002622E5DC|nr:SDR family NAD(P)-dependent oxidoreductase [Neptuniibacter sp.]MCP4595366.1 SDR family NAD(P)-dependent oxidoreductase [Neptuniibacter sp.]